MHFQVSLKDLEDIEGRILSGGSDDEIAQRVRHVYEFLPVETIISIADGIVSIDIPERVIANKLEAIRLHEKASQRAKSGEYAKAISIWERVFETRSDLRARAARSRHGADGSEQNRGSERAPH